MNPLPRPDLRTRFAPLWHLLRDEKRWPLARLALLMLLTAVAEGVGLLLLVPIIDQVQLGTASANPLVNHLVQGMRWLGIPAGLGGLLLVFLGLVAVREILRFQRDTETLRLQTQVIDHHRTRCFERIMRAEWVLVSGQPQAYYSNILITDINRIGQGLRFALNALSTLMLMLISLVAALALSPIMTLVALVSVLVLLAVLGKFRAQATALGHDLSGSNRAIHGCVQESLNGLKLAKLLAGETRLLDRFRHGIADLRRRQLQFQRGSAAASAGLQLGGATLLVLFLYGGVRIWHVPLAELAVLALILARLLPLFSGLHQNTLQWLHALPAAQDILALQHTHRIAAEPAPPPAGSRWPVRHDILVDNVSVQYDARQQPALDQVRILLPAGRITAITGPSGAGKSTLVDVLTGLIVPNSGGIRIDGVLLQPEQRLHWRRAVACVQQDTFLFNTSIRENLLWARPNATDADLHEALERAAADFVLTLPTGLDTVTGDRGVQLSGGERQRIALARALLVQPSLLILDEATSALDAQNEQRIASVLERLRGQITVLIISHRSALLKRADQVVELEQGRVRTTIDHKHPAVMT